MKLVVTANINCDFNTYVEACQQPGAGLNLLFSKAVHTRIDIDAQNQYSNDMQ